MIKTLDINDIIMPDQMATRITEKWIDWDMKRRIWKNDKEEIRRYIFATDTTHTTNSQLPWKNKTTIPKLCQIRDNLLANYSSTMFPSSKWLIWEANERDSDSVRKRDSIVNYMNWAIDQPSFRQEMDRILLDYIDYGNCFATVEWIDERVEQEGIIQSGYIGPMIRRINPLDIVFDPTASSFKNTPKIIRSFVSLGQLKVMLSKLSNDENRQEYEELWKYLKDIRSSVCSFTGELTQQDDLYQMDGFTDFRNYMAADTCEVLTFYGDIYDYNNDKLLRNHVITLVDRHKLINSKPNPSFFGYPPIFHCAWRPRQDNLWGMGPLDNLVGMQYRMDHIENMKADIMDLVTYPVQMIKGFVEDFTWQPGEQIHTSEEGSVELIQPNVQVLQLNSEIQNIERLMEEMAGAPREAMGFRTPGEKTKYEVQSMENASGRVFQTKIHQFESTFEENTLNAMLELARRNLTGTTTIKVFDDKFKAASFSDLTVEDITGIGRIKPIASRHFAEQSQLIQNLTGLTNSQLWPKIHQHFSSERIAKLVEDIFDLKDYEIVLPNIEIAEQIDAQKFAQSLQEQAQQQIGTASGMGHDFDISHLQGIQQQQAASRQQQLQAQPNFGKQGP